VVTQEDDLRAFHGTPRGGRSGIRYFVHTLGIRQRGVGIAQRIGGGIAACCCGQGRVAGGFGSRDGALGIGRFRCGVMMAGDGITMRGNWID
jgi:hypothetical protein